MQIRKSKFCRISKCALLFYFCFFCYSSSALSLVSLILSHIKLVDQQRHGELVAEKIIQVLSLNPNEAAKLMVMSNLEHIIDITMHDYVLGKIL